VNIDGKDYETAVNEDGTWSITLPDDHVLPDGEYPITVVVTDPAGNTATGTGTVTINTVPPTVSVDVVVTNTGTPSISGTTDAPAGSQVVVTIDGKDYETTVNEDGTWSITLPDDHVLPDGEYPITVVITDPAGNTATGTGTLTVDTVFASNATATVPDGTAGEPTTITITLVDGNGNPAPGRADQLEIAIAGANEGAETTAIVDNGDGTYTVTYVPTKTGTDEIAITFKGEAISDSPYTSNVASGLAAEIRILTQPEGGISGQILPTQPVLELYDAQGNLAVNDNSTQVTVSIFSGESGELIGTLTATSVNGIVTFTDLQLAGINNEDYVLEFAVTATENPAGPSAVESITTDPIRVIVPCDPTADEARVSGFVVHGETGEPLQHVMLTLIPQGDTPGRILIQITDETGAYDFRNLPAGQYLVQVQDENLNVTRKLYPVNSSLFFTTLTSCEPVLHNFPYAPSTRPVLAGLVWLDVNGNGIPDEWYDANGDGEITLNVPDENGVYDTDNWEWIDVNGNGRWDLPEDLGEMNRSGFGNDRSGNILVQGPEGYRERLVIIGVQGIWRTRPDIFGEYTISLIQDEFFLEAARAMAETGKVRPWPGAEGSAIGGALSGINGAQAAMQSSLLGGNSTGNTSGGPLNGNTSGAPIYGNPSGTADSPTFIGCSFTESLTVTLSEENPEFTTLDFGVRCFTGSNITATVGDGTVGIPTVVTISINDDEGKPVTGQAEFLATSIAGANAGATTSAIIDNGDGTYTVTYVPTTTGTDEIPITLNGTPIPVSPLTSRVFDPLTLTPDNLPSWVENDEGYSATIVPHGGQGPYTLQFTSGELPAGLTFDPVTGIISGTPTTPGVYTFTVQVTDDRGVTFERPFTINIRDAEVILVPSLHFTRSPNLITEAGFPIGTVVVEVRDQFGNLADWYVGEITISITRETGGPLAFDAKLLSAATTVSVIDGIARFPNLRMERAGWDYTLTATADDATIGISEKFTITPGPPWRLVIAEARDATEDLLRLLDTLREKIANLSDTHNLEGNRIPMIMTIYDEFSNPTSVEEGDTEVELQTTASSGNFFLSQSDNEPTTRITIPVNTSRIIFYYEDPVPGDLVISGDPTPPPGARVITPGEAPLSIRRPGLLRATPRAIDTQIFVRERIVVSLRDAEEVLVRASVPGIPVALTTASSTGRFFASPDSDEEITQVTILPAESSALVYYEDFTLGTHRVHFFGEGVPNPRDSVQVTIRPGPAMAARSQAVVPDGFVGLPTTVTLTLRDQLGNLVLDGIDQIAIEVAEGPNAGTVFAEVTFVGNGVYTVTYLPTAPGLDRIAILINGVAMEGSAFPSRVLSDQPAQLVMVSGNEQSAEILSDLSDPLVVRLLTEDDIPVAGRNIRYRISSMPEGADSAVLSDTSVATGSEGLSQVLFTTGNLTGDYQVEASYGDLVPVVFTITSLPCTVNTGDPARCGEPRYVVTVSEELPQVGAVIDVTAQLTDRFGNMILAEGIAVNWSSNRSTGVFETASTATDSRGAASVKYTVNGVVGLPHLITATDTNSITGTSGEVIPQGGELAATRITGPDTLRVATLGSFLLTLLDDAGNVIVASEDISFQISVVDGNSLDIFAGNGDQTGNGSLERAAGNLITIEAGTYQVPFQLSQTRAGQRNVVASAQAAEHVEGSFKPVYFLPEKVQILSMISGTGQQERVMEQLSELLSVTVLDQYENPIENIEITFELIRTPDAAVNMEMYAQPRNGQMSKTTAVDLSSFVVSISTDSLGVASVVFVLGNRAGDYIIRATSPGLSPVDFVVTALPNIYTLHQNYPNPFNPSTRILFDLPVESVVNLTIYDLLGRRIAVLAEGTLGTGLHSVELNAGALGLATGVYIYRLEALGISTGSQFVTTRKMMYVK
jgi:hypothetical protein